MSANSGERARQESETMEKRPHQAHLTTAVWALAVFTAFLFGSTLVNIHVTQRACEVARSQIDAIKILSASMKEVQKSMVGLSKAIQEAQESAREEEQEAPYSQSPSLGDERI